MFKMLCTLYYKIRSSNHIDQENNGQKSISLTKKLDFFTCNFVGLTYCFRFKLHYMCIEIHVFLTFDGNQ